MRGWSLAAALGVLQASEPVSAFSPQAESILEILRGRIAAGAAGEDAYTAFLDLLAEGDEDGCEGWRDRPEFTPMPSAKSGLEEMRFGEIRSALEEVCPEPVIRSGTEKTAGRGPEKRAKKARAAVSVSQAVQPRQDRARAAPDIQGAGSWPQGAWTLSLRDYLPHQRYLRLGSERLAFHAGHLQPALSRTRLGFVAGGRFYTDRSGASGAGGAWFSPRQALDGLGISATAGGWSLEAAGAWNRLTAPGGREGEAGEPVRRDALAYLAGIGRGPDIRFQAAHLRSEPGSAAPAGISLAGARLGGRVPGWAEGWLGAAASMPYATAAPGGPPALLPAGAFLETGLASIPSHSAPEAPEAPGISAGSTWRLEARQASAEWANPLQSPRGILRDTLAGEWIVRGGGEGGIEAGAGFPVAVVGRWNARLQGRMGAGWSLEYGMLAHSGGLGLTQAWARDRDRWTWETGASLGWRRQGLPGTPAATKGGAEDGTEAGETGGLGQGVSWSRGPWVAKASFTWKGGDYSGDRSAPAGLEWRHRADGGGSGGNAEGRAGSWSLRLYTGDIRNPGSYLRAEARQVWKPGGRLKVEQEIRLPWTREGLAADMGYQLRLETAL